MSVKTNLIGEFVEIIDAKNKTLKGLKGRVIDETKNTIIIECDDKIRKILKKGVKLKKGKEIIIGEEIIGRPEIRLKKREKVKKRW